MDFIVSILSSALAFFCSVLGNVLAHDICASADRTCTKIIGSAARRLAPFDRDAGEREWLADLHERLTVYEKYKHAIGCFLVAGKMRRQAQAITIMVSIQIEGVGTIPLSFNMQSPLRRIFSAAATSRFQWVKGYNIIFAVLYLFYKFAKAAKVSCPQTFKKFRDVKLTDYKNWGYEARLKRKGLDIDLGQLFRFLIENPKQTPDVLRKFTEIMTGTNHLQSTPQQLTNSTQNS
jgi:hypothetical protein